ncbi:hypothetical protein ASG92_21420 [Arthrobacter sp. Soil736]|uniref:hypothetical protein n=1 Tax=Arthrobacter sp. Soil736 TaxID=1736395 RepID=UPI0006FBF4ED|nr:hypothetical protein [Arthrobacter sp. Soil736]KRE60517.1 hypothetical protein ASG92_21420 [Arthrobacter sp. Soil736]
MYQELRLRYTFAFTFVQFFVADGDKVPMTFSRNATAHTVSPRQFNRRNAVQGIMVACSLLYRLDEEAQALKLATEQWWPWATGSGPPLQTANIGLNGMRSANSVQAHRGTLP